VASAAHQIDPADLTVRLTAMRRRHLRGVLHIENQVYPKPWSMGLFLGELALRHSRIYAVARVGPRVVGYTGVMFAVDEGHVTTVAVDPAWQRCKVASRLLVHTLRAGIGRGTKAFTLEVRMGNAGAQTLYRSFGFAPAGVRKNYYAEIGEDALIMWAHDVDTPEYAARLDALEAAIPGQTIVEGLS
jgi:ribosomal-protein-alanine N-acetyltransferase